MKQKVTKPAKPVAAIHADTGLTALQEKCAILLAAGTRISDAAQQVGASRCTLYRWLNQPAFICYFNMAKKEVQQYVEGSLLEMHQQALEGIKASLESIKEEVRLKAAVWVMDRISKMQIGETDIRKVLQEKCEIEYEVTFGGGAYQKALEEAGLEG